MAIYKKAKYLKKCDKIKFFKILNILKIKKEKVTIRY